MRCRRHYALEMALGVGLSDLQRSFPNQTTLCLYANSKRGEETTLHPPNSNWRLKEMANRKTMEIIEYIRKGYKNTSSTLSATSSIKNQATFPPQTPWALCIRWGMLVTSPGAKPEQDSHPRDKRCPHYQAKDLTPNPSLRYDCTCSHNPQTWMNVQSTLLSLLLPQSFCLFLP